MKVHSGEKKRQLQDHTRNHIGEKLYAGIVIRLLCLIVN